MPPPPPLPTTTQPSTATAAEAEPSLGLPETVLDLLAAQSDRGDYRLILDRVVAAFRGALEAGNPSAAMAALVGLHAERRLRAREAAFAAQVDAALARCDEREAMAAYTSVLAAVKIDSADHRVLTDLLAGLGPRAVGSLMDILAVEPSRPTRRRLLDVLVGIGPANLALIARYANHPEWYVVRNVVCILGNLGLNAMPTLLKTTYHSEPRVRIEAVRALATMATPAAVRAIVRLLGDDDEAVVREAAAQIASLHARSAASALHALAHSPRFADFQAETMQAVAYALGTLGDGEAAQAIRARLAAGAECAS